MKKSTSKIYSAAAGVLVSALFLFSCATAQTESTITAFEEGARTDTVKIGSSEADYSTLKNALESAPDEVSRFIIDEGVYTEWDIQVNRNAEIIGAGADKTILQGAENPGEAPDRMFTIGEDIEVSLRDLTVRHGVATEMLRRGGGILNLGTLRMDECRITGNSSVYGAGMDNRGRAVITNSLFQGNFTLPMNREERMTGEGCTGSGGGIKNEPGGVLMMSNCELSENKTLRRGGGLFVSCESRAVLYKCIIRENISKRAGGGINLRGDLALYGCTISGNTSTRGAGGIHNMGFLDMADNRVTGNSLLDFQNGDGGAGFYGHGIQGINQNNTIEKM